eukprot:s863_g54.t1
MQATATAMQRQDSMICRASSFQDATMDHALAASISSRDASAWALTQSGTTGSDLKRKELPQGGLNRAGTLDRATDALSATDLAVEPESTETHAKRQKKTTEPKDKEKLPVLTKAERARYVDYWQAFKCKHSVQEMIVDQQTQHKANGFWDTAT